MMAITKLCLLLGGLCLASDGMARKLKACMVDERFAPVSSPSTEMPGQYLLRKALESRGDTVEFFPSPWRRCIDSVRHGEMDIPMGGGANPDFFGFLSFPRAADGSVDRERRLASYDYLVLRVKGSAANWNGEKFEGLQFPVLYASGQMAIKNRLAKIGQEGSDGAKTQMQQLTMLLANRSDIAVMVRDRAEALLREKEFAGKIEILDKPFLTNDAYVPIRTTLYETDKKYFDSLWADIVKLRSAPDWPKIERKLLDAKD